MMEKLYQARKATVKALLQAGVPLLAGTDLGFAFVYPGDLGKELELLVDAGLSPAQALRTATLNPAIFLNKEMGLGVIAEGKLADIAILDGNPLEHIGNVKFVNTVIFNGKIYSKQDFSGALSKFN